MKPLITAHTGSNGTPENTIESLIAGARFGADIQEVDVRSLKDGTPILWHDPVFLFKGGGSALIESLTIDELNGFACKGLIDVTLLDKSLSTAKEHDLMMNLDIKTDGCIQSTVSLLKRQKLIDQVLFSGCDFERASFLHLNYPKIQKLLNVDVEILNDAGIEGVCRLAAETGCCGINISFEYYTEQLQNYARKRFMPVAIWTVNASDGFERFLNSGVHSITTLDVKELAATLSAAAYSESEDIRP